MKNIYYIFMTAGIVLIALILWMLNMNIRLQEILTIIGILSVLGFAIFIGIDRIIRTIRKEPLEDEFSKKVMNKASSLSFYFSLYLWLFIMYFSDKTKLETHSLIGAGILGMAIIFFLSWVGVKIYGIKNE